MHDSEMAERLLYIGDTGLSTRKKIFIQSRFVFGILGNPILYVFRKIDKSLKFIHSANERNLFGNCNLCDSFDYDLVYFSTGVFKNSL